VGPLLSRREDNLWELSGDLDMRSVPRVLEQAEGLFKNGAEAVVDLAEVDRIDSAGLALLVEWLRQAKRQGVAIHFRNIPARMLAIATVCGLEQLLPESAFKAQVYYEARRYKAFDRRDYTAGPRGSSE
jgi:phospholipid transport system transporter-binding protein